MLKTFAIAICSIGLSTAVFAQSSTTSPSTTTPSTPPAASSGTSGSGSGMTTGSTNKSAAECETNWKSADKNTDGRLDQTEMNSVKSTLPTSLQSAASVTQTQYMSACQGR